MQSTCNFIADSDFSIFFNNDEEKIDDDLKNNIY